MSLEAREDHEQEDESQAVPDANHKHPTVAGRIQASYCHDVLNLPTRASQMSDGFRRALSMAYEIYGTPGIIQFPASSLQWSKKLSFTDP
jgi:hypothetical protein